jgi:hypothetical protein
MLSPARKKAMKSQQTKTNNANMISTKTKVTEKFRITGDWALQAKWLKEKYSQLTDSDLKHEADRDDELLNRLQRRLCRNRDGIIEIIKGIETSAPFARGVRL